VTKAGDEFADCHAPLSGNLPLASLSALGVVFGDIGTSPLYTLKSVLALTGEAPPASATLGALSLIVWTLIVVTTIKYVSVAMRVDNDGEGGILALLALLGVKRERRPTLVAVGLLGAALIYGDGAITPAISVLSALEGLKIATPSVEPYILPGTIAILLALFAVQPLGTARIGRTFGPIMLLWFVSIAALGIWGIAKHPAVLEAIDPRYGLNYLLADGFRGFVVLGAVFLCVTGAEALYADMGQFGARPIRLAWTILVFPSLILNYAGQAALVLNGAPTSENVFYRLCPSSLLLPLVVLATIATIIASQSIITGAFSMTRQAIQLGWLPRVRVIHTSAETYGQIYVGIVNCLLMIATVGLALAFGKSSNLAAAYGIAVSATMLMTTVLLFIAMREILRWSLPAAAALAGVFLIVDTAFFSSNLTKIAEGGYVPLLFAGCVYSIMMIWHVGVETVAKRIHETVQPIGEFLAAIRQHRIPRVPGTAVFLTQSERDAPPVMVWHLKHNRSLHEQVFVLHVITESIPRVRNVARLAINAIAPKFWHGRARYGFMEHPNIPALLRQARDNHGCDVTLDDITYYVGHASIIHREDGKALPRWLEEIFAFMQRNSVHASHYFRLPPQQVVEIGREISI
jgi:KUP system potassium uptake protein